MSNYVFTPAFAFQRGEHTHTYWRNGLTNEELDEVVNIGLSLPLNKARIALSKNPEVDISRIRTSQTSWIKERDCPFLYSKLAWIIQQLNGQFYNYDLWGFHEDMQFTVYEGDQAGHYEWHQDSMGNTVDENNIDQRPPRKLSLILQLSDPSEYDGGEIQIMSGIDPISLPRERGLITVFPSFMVHRVTPVTKGIRRSLVVWVTGPAFR